MLFRKLAAPVLILSSVGALFLAALIIAPVLKPQDLTSYWAAAHLVRQNPYSSDLVSILEHKSGIAVGNPPLVMRNPPWAIPFVLPLGAVSYRVGFAVWTVLSIVLVVGCTRAIWHLFDPVGSIYAVLLPLIFGPTIVLLILGQWSALVLLGITGFLFAAERGSDWIAGASLLLVMGKPHVALILLVAIVLWTVQTKRWRIIYSAVLATAAASIVVLSLNPHVFAQFLEHTRGVLDEEVAYPNAGGLLYRITGKREFALIPQLGGLAWISFYWKKHRSSWDWKRNGMLVLAVSIACSYYSYPYDEVMVIPALVSAFLTGNRKTFIALFVITDLGYLAYLSQVAGKFGFDYMFLSWTGIAWLITYISARRQTQRSGVLATTS